MTIEAVVGQTQIQTLQYQTNNIAFSYGQDCGGYKIDVTPKYPFFTFSMSGINKDPQNRTYTDMGTFKAGKIDDIG